MGSTTSKRDESSETKDVKDNEKGENEILSKEEHEGDNQGYREPVAEEKILPKFSPQAQSCFTAPGVSESSDYFFRICEKMCSSYAL